jgi:hypothetical protein
MPGRQNPALAGGGEEEPAKQSRRPGLGVCRHLLPPKGESKRRACRDSTDSQRTVAEEVNRHGGFCSSRLPVLCPSLMDLEEIVGPHHRFQGGDESIAQVLGEAFEQGQEIPEALVPLHLRLAAGALFFQR